MTLALIISFPLLCAGVVICCCALSSRHSRAEEDRALLASLLASGLASDCTGRS